MNIVLVTLQCSALVLITIATFGIGLWSISRFVGFENKYAFLLCALVIGFTFFTASLTGMLIDPRADLSKVLKIIKLSGLFGLIAFASVLIITPIYQKINTSFQVV